jgi:hypothetical protein
MENQRQNPLSGYFRQAAIYVKLPSSGKWWDDNALELPVTGEIPVFPMTTKDEVVLRTPDALLNGQGIVEVIQSCCPNIKDAWKMPSVDVDAVLIAIRIATYGNNMSFDSKCSHCGEENTHDVDLGQPLSSITCPDYRNTIEYKDLKIKLQPQHYFGVNRANLVSFEEQKLSNILANSELDPEVKSQKLTVSMQRLVELGLLAVADSTEYIETADGDRITDKEFIKEFYEKAESAIVKQIQDKLTDFATESKIKPMNLACNDCGKPYKMELTFDYANFFGKGF